MKLSAGTQKFRSGQLRARFGRESSVCVREFESSCRASVERVCVRAHGER